MRRATSGRISLVDAALDPQPVGEGRYADGQRLVRSVGDVGQAWAVVVGPGDLDVAAGLDWPVDSGDADGAEDRFDG